MFGYQIDKRGITIVNFDFKVDQIKHTLISINTPLYMPVKSDYKENELSRLRPNLDVDTLSNWLECRPDKKRKKRKPAEDQSFLYSLLPKLPSNINQELDPQPCLPHHSELYMP